MPEHSNIDIRKIPLSLYIHLPWCLHKCPYCDFNSHATKADEFPEEDYVRFLIADLIDAIPLLNERKIISIFFGGGTPSLFAPESIAKILNSCDKYLSLKQDCEITLETNPGTFEYQKFAELLASGINRLSIGVQSFQQKFLSSLERIHSAEDALTAIDTAKQIGFKNINIDLMFGLPGQSVHEAIEDVQIACSQEIEHVSFYNLTLEPNTIFHRFPPVLPSDEECWQMQAQGVQLLEANGYQRYEVSAYAKKHQQCQHNYNYWQYGDYLGIGAGAHSKITTQQGILRFERPKQPTSYMDAVHQHLPPLRERYLDSDALVFEFMLNNLRLCKGLTPNQFSNFTGISWDSVEQRCDELIQEGLLTKHDDQLHTTVMGYRFLDTVTERFLSQ